MATKEEKLAARLAKKEAKIRAKVEKKAAKDAKREAKKQAAVDAKLASWERRVSPGARSAQGDGNHFFGDGGGRASAASAGSPSPAPVQSASPRPSRGATPVTSGGGPGDSYPPATRAAPRDEPVDDCSGCGSGSASDDGDGAAAAARPSVTFSEDGGSDTSESADESPEALPGAERATPRVDPLVTRLTSTVTKGQAAGGGGGGGGSSSSREGQRGHGRASADGGAAKGGGIAPLLRTASVGGFTHTQLAIDKEIAAAVRRAHAAKGIAVVAVRIDSSRKAYALDWEKQPATGRLSAESIVPLMEASVPRFYVISGKQLGSHQPVFVYACPSQSPRAERMIYATSKLFLTEAVDGMGQATLHVEVTDPEDLTTDDLLGIVPDADEVPAEPRAAAPKATMFNPASQAGSLGALMAKTLGHQPSGRKIVRSPDAAHI